MRRLVLTAAATALSAGAFAQNQIDLMNEGEFMIDGSDSITTGSDSNILGGSRFASTSASGAVAMRNFGNDFVTFTNNSGVASTFVLDYGDFDGGNGELNNDFGTDSAFFAVEIPRVVGLGQLVFDAESSLGVGSSAAQMITTPGTYYFGFDDTGYGEVDFADIDRVTFRLIGTNGSEFDIGPITRQATPAPGGLALLSLGGLVAARRRR